MSDRILRYDDTTIVGTAEANGSTVVERDSNGDTNVRRLVATNVLETEGGLAVKVSTKTANFTCTEDETVVIVDCTGGPVTITLPPPADFNHLLCVKRYDATASTTLANYATVSQNSAETIDGDASIYLTLQGEAVWLQSNGTNWRIVHRYLPQLTVAKSAAFNVACEGTVYLCTMGSAYSATFGAASVWKGKRLIFKSVSGANILTLDGNASETIDGATTNTAIATAQEALEVVSDGTGWHIIGGHPTTS
jgi:hypothetical protein